MSRFTIVVPAHRVQGYLRECLESVLAQSYADFELTVVDDASPDAGAAIAAEYAERDDRVRLLRHAARRGTGAARNTGAAEARGDYLLFLDGDDTLLPGALTAIDEALRAEDDPDVLAFGHDRIDWWETVRTVTDDFTGDPLALTPAAWNRVFRREFWSAHALRFAPEGPYEDVVPVHLATLRAGDRTATLDRVCVRWRERRGGLLSMARGSAHFVVLRRYAELMEAARAGGAPGTSAVVIAGGTGTDPVPVVGGVCDAGPGAVAGGVCDADSGGSGPVSGGVLSAGQVAASAVGAGDRSRPTSPPTSTPTSPPTSPPTPTSTPISASKSTSTRNPNPNPSANRNPTSRAPLAGEAVASREEAVPSCSDSDRLFPHMAAHLLAVLGDPHRIRVADRRDFFRGAAALYWAHLPEGFEPPPGGPGAGHRALASGSYADYRMPVGARHPGHGRIVSGLRRPERALRGRLMRFARRGRRSTPGATENGSPDGGSTGRGFSDGGSSGSGFSDGGSSGRGPSDDGPSGSGFSDGGSSGRGPSDDGPSGSGSPGGGPSATGFPAGPRTPGATVSRHSRTTRLTGDALPEGSPSDEHRPRDPAAARPARHTPAGPARPHPKGKGSLRLSPDPAPAPVPPPPHAAAPAPAPETAPKGRPAP
ncbi:glycosyltransferase family 2 protein [Streptomyces tsukubensis]|uniref:glycosyltransferase family 2 protein n=1 Tax=Streptomyces tsukubensis TaxID=83656 RepID=UPI00269C7784|nr:glycosyltransferase family 2 protein [Streptomyces tsukubensis]